MIICGLMQETCIRFLHLKNNTYFKDFANPVSIARRLSKEKVNNILVGEGAEKFAHKGGFERKICLQTALKFIIENRVKEVREQEIKPYAGHDTVGMVCLDQQGKMTSATSTSGLFMKKKRTCWRFTNSGFRILC